MSGFYLFLIFSLSSFIYHKGDASNFLALNEISGKTSSHETDENGTVLAGALKKKKAQVPESLYCPLKTSSSLLIILWEPVTAPDSQALPQTFGIRIQILKYPQVFCMFINTWEAPV